MMRLGWSPDDGAVDLVAHANMSMVMMAVVMRAMMTEVVTVSLLVTEVSLLCWEAPIPDRRSGGVSGGKGAGG